MIIPGRALLTRSIIRNVQNPALQVQPCGVDLTLKRILTWTSPGIIDLDNQRRQTASTNEIPFLAPRILSRRIQRNSSVPLDMMGQIFVRSSLFRSGVLLTTGVMDSGYVGAVGALMQVLNPAGLRVYPSARLAQFVFHQMSEEVEGYSGVYQGRTAL
ncbi:putative dUTP diphosphatase Dut [Aspergillus fumigatus Af293]|uniref:dUTP diphosphatase Dut, putative n=1 Tax=Aspergillus fumigatus (strain ATCC MYA-4609 / CBS 101355 / FGSC A1100 / Af293) TaxID=330879 RepID=Q4WGG8_ASPFU|nr:dUTP diphosphatase Dut, putative [Aspergillus fumigatus Af293]EAL86973.1 dUTP diphosphatase Dut, putative [Aspergillus fumigatus Af293]